MPPLPPVPKTLKVTMNIGVNVALSPLNILHFTYSGGPPSPADCHSIAVQVRTLWAVNMPALVHTSGGLRSVHVLDIDSTTGNDGTDATVVSGTRPGTVLPINDCVVVNYKIAQRWRGGKPRSYIPALVTGDLTDNKNWSAVPAANVAADQIAWMQALVSFTAGSTVIQAPVCVSRISNKVKRTPPVTFPITGATAQVLVGSQRRRVREA